jgi:hypothetical protein
MHRKALLLIAFSTLLSLLLASCCVDEWRWSGDVVVVLMPNSVTMTSGTMVVDTVDAPFRYTVELDFQLLALAAPLDIFAPRKLTALSCDESYDTRIEAGSHALVIDRTVLLDGQPLLPGTNFVDLLLEISPERSPTFTNSQRVYLDFSAEILQRLTFTEGMHTFTYTAMTEGGEAISESVTTYMKL